MITTPYATLREALGKEPDWQPDWAQRLEVRRHDDTTVYVAHPDRIDTQAIDDLNQLQETGWQIIIDTQRLNRVRVSLWQ